MKGAGVIGVVAGSGLDLEPLLDEREEVVTFEEAFGRGRIGTEGHAGRFVRGTCRGVPLVIQSGRRHFYEGYDFGEVVRPVDFLSRWDVRKVVLTNAAGGLGRTMLPGDLMSVRKLLRWPCRLLPEGDYRDTLEPDFVIRGADHEGAYLWIHGPTYETKAEIRALAAMNAAAVGMSTFPEVWACQMLGIETAVISCITNNCLEQQVLTHEHVIATARRASERLREVIRGSLLTIAGAI